MATSPIPRRTTSCDSLLRCAGGNQLRTNVPARALPNVQMNVIDAIVMARMRDRILPEPFAKRFQLARFGGHASSATMTVPQIASSTFPTA